MTDSAQKHNMHGFVKSHEGHAFDTLYRYAAVRAKGSLVNEAAVKAEAGELLTALFAGEVRSSQIHSATISSLFVGFGSFFAATVAEASMKGGDLGSFANVARAVTACMIIPCGVSAAKYVVDITRDNRKQQTAQKELVADAPEMKAVYDLAKRALDQKLEEAEPSREEYWAYTQAIVAIPG